MLFYILEKTFILYVTKKITKQCSLYVTNWSDLVTENMPHHEFQCLLLQMDFGAVESGVWNWSGPQRSQGYITFKIICVYNMGNVSRIINI